MLWPSIMSHVSIGSNDLARSLAFYDAVLATLGGKRLIEHPGEAVAYGRQYPEFWVNTPLDNKPATTSNGVHFAFHADSKTDVDAFYKAALAQGAEDSGAPGSRAAYGAPYYGCFVKDPDGHKIEATFWDTEMDADTPG
ncbi:MAG: VOC family protein [Paracoccaceae bacterium]